MTEISIAEQSARAAALGQYARFLLKRYQRLELIEIGETDPVSLRQIFVPMRVGSEDLREEQVGEDVEDVHEEKLPGEDAWDVLIRRPFVALSGRPGSGKTTLVQAIVAELCNDSLPSRLREETRAIPVPLILRNIPGLETVRNLKDLYDRWWPLLAEQAEHDRLPLDLPRLEQELFPFGAAPRDFSVLVLFDGIDEVGGPAIRQRLINLAYEAAARGFRVLVTGRPTGFADLVAPVDAGGENRVPLKLCYLLPFAWTQIEQFVDRWYRLRDEWERKRKEGVSHFLGHLEDRGRGYLLSLARRPIFLTLMALVHTTQNQMPEGRPLLYRHIVDLYLERQERQRQRIWTTQGEPMPHWPAAEIRLVLAYLAWQSQSIGSRVKEAYQAEARRLVWGRDKMEETIRRQIEEGPGRFAELTAGNAPDLVKYFLHPAGLLVEPEEGKIQFSHLSFQEYLCAWFLHERAKVDKQGLQEFLRDELFAHLGEPGWDEVGILLLRIRADETGQEGHFELLRWLDLADVAQATLFVTAVAGRELPFTDRERQGFFPAAVACALLHPDRELGTVLARVPDWKEEGLALLSRLFEAEGVEAGWACLEKASKPVMPFSEDMKRRWIKPPDDLGWTPALGPIEARAHSLLRLLNLADWVEAESTFNPIANPLLEERLAGWLERQLQAEPRLLLTRTEEEGGDFPTPTATAFELDLLLPDHGRLWRRATQSLSVDFLLLQGEAADEKNSYLGSFSEAIVLFTIHPVEPVGPRNQLALLLYQVSLLIEGAPRGRELDEWSQSLSRLRAQSLLRSLSRPMLRSLSRSKSLSQSLARSQSRALALSQSRLPWPTASESLSLPLPLAETTEQSLKRFLGERQAQDRFTLEPFRALARFGFRFAALDWFREQIEEPEKRERRGLRAGEPLPQHLGLFDKAGLPLPVQPRAAWQDLARWLENNEAILEFAFPEGLPAADAELLEADLEQLRKQPWSPMAALKALLVDWPANEPERPYTLEAADLDLRAACEEALETLHAKKPKKRR